MKMHVTKRTVKMCAAAAICGVILANGAGVAGQSPWGMVAQAHSRRTGSCGGHHGSRNAGAQESYYHCGGHPAHLHTDGVCPYADSTGSAAAETTAASAGNGWHHDGQHWRYGCDDGTSASGCWKEIDGSWYCFDDEGCMRTGWYDQDGYRYYLDSDGKRVSGDCVIGGHTYHFGHDGRMVTPDVR